MVRPRSNYQESNIERAKMSIWSSKTALTSSLLIKHLDKRQNTNHFRRKKLLSQPLTF